MTWLHVKVTDKMHQFSLKQNWPFSVSFLIKLQAYNFIKREALKMANFASVRMGAFCNQPLHLNISFSLIVFNPFQVNVPFLYPLSTSGNLWFFEVFRGYRNVTLA